MIFAGERHIFVLTQDSMAKIIPLGSYLCPAGAMINHSCDPNSHHVSEGHEISFRSVCDIQKGEEITSGYRNGTLGYDERQRELFESYAFHCRCSRCALKYKCDNEMLTGFSKKDEITKIIMSELDTLSLSFISKSINADDAVRTLKTCCNRVSPGKKWTVYMHPVPTILTFIAQRYEIEKQWKNALHYWFKIVYVIDPRRYRHRLLPPRIENLHNLAQLSM